MEIINIIIIRICFLRKTIFLLSIKQVKFRNLRTTFKYISFCFVKISLKNVG